MKLIDLLKPYPSPRMELFGAESNRISKQLMKERCSDLDFSTIYPEPEEFNPNDYLKLE